MVLREVPAIRWLITRDNQAAGAVFAVLDYGADARTADAIAALIVETTPVQGFPPDHQFVFRCPAESLTGERNSVLRVSAGKNITLWPTWEGRPRQSDVRTLLKLLHEHAIGICLSARDANLADALSIDPPDLIALDEDETLSSIVPGRIGHDLQSTLFVPRATNDATRNRHALRIAAPWIGSDEAAPVRAAGIKADTVELLRLIAATYADASIAELSDRTKRQPGLVVRLIQAAHTPAWIASRPADVAPSVPDAIQALGVAFLRNLCRFALGAIYSRIGPLHTLVVLARFRGMLMQKLAIAAHGRRGFVPPEEAFLVGMLSMLPRITGLTLEDTLQDVALPQRFGDALLRGQGWMGDALAVTHAVERGTEPRATMLDELPPGIIAQCRADAMAWAMSPAPDEDQ